MRTEIQAEPLESSRWHTVRGFNQPGGEVAKVIKRLKKRTNWLTRSGTEDLADLHGEVVDGAYMSEVAELALPWLVALAEERPLWQLQQFWMILGEAEVARLSGAACPVLPALFPRITALAEFLLPGATSLPDRAWSAAWAVADSFQCQGRLLAVRLGIPVDPVGVCPECNNPFRVDFNHSWQTTERTFPGSDWEKVLRQLKAAGEKWDVMKLRQIEQLSAHWQCRTCRTTFDILSGLDRPLPRG